jgi:hypothetical protein
MSYSYFRHQKIFNNIKWCIASSQNAASAEDRRCELKLRNTILRLQEELAINKEYKIIDAEFGFVIDIIHGYQNDLVQKYFNGYALNYLNLSEEEYYIATFNAFLQRHERERTFNDNEMYTVKDYKSYGTWGNPLFDAKYVLTDFAVTYHKLYYITQLKCIKLHGRPINNNSIANLSLENSKKAIDTREIEVSRI